jgi:uncharacterized protein (TIGR02266 family)
VPLKLLLVEDDLPTLELMLEVLSSLKAEVRALSNSQQAAALVDQERFDGIFVDLQMPGVDGFELARRVRDSSWNKSAPIVVVTGHHDSSTMQKAFAAGATFFLQKPVDRQRLTNLFNAVRGGMFDNRRQFIRVPLQTEVTCQVGNQTFRGTSSNISQGGILFEVGRSLSPGTPVRLSFRLPGRELRFEVTGIVARLDEKKRAGVRFTHIGTRELQLIRDLLGSDEDENTKLKISRT